MATAVHLAHFKANVATDLQGEQWVTMPIEEYRRVTAAGSGLPLRSDRAVSLKNDAGERAITMPLKDFTGLDQVPWSTVMFEVAVEDRQ